MKYRTWFVMALCATLALGDAFAAPKSYSGGSSKPSATKPSVSKPSTPPRPPASKPPAPKPTAPKVTPPAPRVTPPSAPKAPPTSKYSGGNTAPKPIAPPPAAPKTPPISVPKTPPVAPKYSGGNTNIAPQTGSTSVKPKSVFNAPDVGTGSVKPKSEPVSDKARANMQAASERGFLKTQQAVAPPKTDYVAPSGKTVKVDIASPAVAAIRTRPSTELAAPVRQQRTQTHVNHYHYSHPSDWYYTQPAVHVGGGYSSAFWWMMMTDWSAERRARWLYNNQDRIERDAYERGIRDSATAAEIARLQQQNAVRDPHYVDQDFKDNPDLMYEQQYVEAAYNPEPAPTAPVPTPAPSSRYSGMNAPKTGIFRIVGYAFLTILSIVGIIWLVAFKRW